MMVLVICGLAYDVAEQGLQSKLPVQQPFNDPAIMSASFSSLALSSDSGFDQVPAENIPNLLTDVHPPGLYFQGSPMVSNSHDHGGSIGQASRDVPAESESFFLLRGGCSRSMYRAPYLASEESWSMRCRLSILVSIPFWTDMNGLGL